MDIKGQTIPKCGATITKTVFIVVSTWQGASQRIF